MNTTFTLVDWITNEGQASGSFEDFLWSCRPQNQPTSKVLTESDKQFLRGFSELELNESIDAIERQHGFETSRDE